jgi:hypothetical protein
MKSIDDIKGEMEKLYKEMYELTEPECSKSCRIPRSCCYPQACEMATDRAAEFGVTLVPTGHRITYMGENGCVVPPYLRPLCTLHTCDISGLGFKRDDPDGSWTAHYFNLREQIDQLEAELYINFLNPEKENDD